VSRTVRAFDDSFGAYSYFDTGSKGVKRVKLVKVSRPSGDVFGSAAGVAPGTLRYAPDAKALGVACADGWLALDTLHVESKATPVSGRDFAIGYKVTRNSAQRLLNPPQ
jgi:methionyl-tRNA formyltransferase